MIHLARRFFQSILGRGPDAAEEAWLVGLLTEGEAALYRQMSMPDRCHALRAAKSPVLVDDAQRVAAALHDVGKTPAGLGTLARVAATAAGAVAPSLLRGRWALYDAHPRVGAEMLRNAGSAEMTVVWAQEHHLDPDQCSLGPDAAETLAAAD